MTQIIQQNRIRQTLEALGAIKQENIEVFSQHTRDQQNLAVYRDKASKVIFIDQHYVGDEEYQSGQYRNQDCSPGVKVSADYEDAMDSRRRFARYEQFVIGKTICDFGCGAGSFLRLAKRHSENVSGIELQKDFVERLRSEGISCFSNSDELKNLQDTFFLFHCLEHLPDPVRVLQDLKTKLKPDGRGQIVVEVPHARDFLIEQMGSQAFIDFTLWSQHLILHTRDSLTLMLQAAGYRNITIEGVQRYNISNHLTWLKDGKPGGHKSPLSLFETEELRSAYAGALAKIDATDTLVAIATT